jgi:hypothetical protein
MAWFFLETDLSRSFAGPVGWQPAPPHFRKRGKEAGRPRGERHKVC